MQRAFVHFISHRIFFPLFVLGSAGEQNEASGHDGGQGKVVCTRNRSEEEETKDDHSHEVEEVVVND
jgi:hypothetical protein